MGQKRISFGGFIGGGDLNEICSLEYLSVDRRIILKWILDGIGGC